ncbi:hypothetical protein OB955_13570 [Halobacteria archaeon AArc-m2/3/4]|uniref:ABC transporter transmembrane region n=1 Tax=Natronoglomus mannanivorans TaxID=2979990 RepID=A0ABT2QFR6_9EURY|nr:hypothetical protein [Halobacteria archaeon AArc-m2/3/4]
MSHDSDGTTAVATTEPASHADPSVLALEEARATFEYQVQRLREIDNKAIEILKANLLIIGVFVTALSVLGQTALDVASFVNLHTAVGGLLLLASTAIAGVTYTASNLRGGVDRPALEAALADGQAFESTLVRSYGAWIEHNAEVTAINDVLVTITVLFVIDAFVYFVVGIAVGTLPVSTLTVVASFVLLTALLAPLTWLAYNMDNIEAAAAAAENDRREATALELELESKFEFEGVRISKGTSRKRGHDALRRMLWPDDEE